MTIERVKVLYTYLAAAMFVFTACNSVEHEVTEVQQKDSYIRISTTVGELEGIKTRAPFLNEPSAKNKLTANIFISKTQSDYSTLWNTGKTAAEFTSATGPGFGTKPEQQVLWPADKTEKLYFIGTSPQNGFSVLSTDNNILTAKANGCTDFLYTGAETAHSKQEKTVQLNFKHAQVLCRLYIQAENQQAIDDWGGQLVTAQVLKVNYQDATASNNVSIPKILKLSAKDGKISLEEDPSDNTFYTFYGINNEKVQEAFLDTKHGNIAISADKQSVVGYLMLPVGTDALNQLKSLQIQLASKTFKEVSGEKTPKIAQIDLTTKNAVAGSALNINLKLKKEGTIEFEGVTVTEWENVQDANGEIGG
ncbi:MAG: fimbrillin family protein [Mediterranea sp.]|jgi:hypothetical protein|nr:fimbrillin family protein [Mediterranea sp.]